MRSASRALACVAAAAAAALPLSTAPARAVETHAPIAASYDACPHVWEFERGGTSEFYALVLRAQTAMTVDATLHVYLKGKSYTLAMPGISIAKPGGTRTVAFRSEPFVIRSPDTSAEPAMMVAYGGDAAACPAESRDLAQKAATRYEPVDAFKKLESAIVAETPDAGVHGLPEDDPDAVPSCALPYREAAATTATAPVYPEIAKAANDTGTSIAIVSLDERGAPRRAETYATSATPGLDRATIDAALHSVYRPRIAACIATPATFLFRADFVIGS